MIELKYIKQYISFQFSSTNVACNKMFRRVLLKEIWQTRWIGLSGKQTWTKVNQARGFCPSFQLRRHWLRVLYILQESPSFSGLGKVTFACLYNSKKLYMNDLILKFTFGLILWLWNSPKMDLELVSSKSWHFIRP